MSLEAWKKRKPWAILLLISAGLPVG
jgi:hypothetical protein